MAMWGFHTRGTQKIDDLFHIFHGHSQPNMDENGRGTPMT